jgi:hypothetical protein
MIERITKPALIALLRSMADEAPSSTEGLKALEEKAWELWQRVKASPAVYDAPPEVWHFLSDADIRYKDPRYHALQRERLLEVLDAWLRGPNART